MNKKFNPLGYELFNQPKKIFGNAVELPSHNKFIIDKAKKNLASFGYNEPNQEKVYRGEIELPELLGSDIKEHFENMSQELIGKQLDMLFKFATRKLLWTKKLVEDAINHPSLDIVGGWQRYHIDGGSWEKVEYPDDGVLIYDTETYVLGGNYPIIGQAMNHTYLYLWLPENLDPQNNLIPIGHNKILIGHNVGFDLGKTLEPYTLDEHDNLWVDTQSMHIIVAGLAAGQRWYKALKNSSHKGKLSEEQKRRLLFDPDWGDKGATNSLVEVYNHHVVELAGFFDKPPRLEEGDKELRDMFVKSPLETIQNGICNGELLIYAFLDVFYTFLIFIQLYPKFRQHKPTKTSFAGFILRMDGRIPVCKDWFKWVRGCEDKYNELQEKVAVLIRKEAKILYEKFLEDPEYFVNDPWLKQLKWVVETKKGKYAGVPKWYRPFIKNENHKVTTKSLLAHIVLKLTWEKSPIVKIKGKGWCYEEHGRLRKIPHYKEEGANVGELITKNYMYAVEAGILESQGSDQCKEIFQIAKSCSYWRGIRSRVMGKIIKEENGTLITVAEPLPYGTITGRVVEKLMLTLCSTKRDRIGTELKTRITAPDGWSIVGFDIDQEEMHIAALLADKQSGSIVGSSPLSFQVLTGNKADGTDAHSALANFLQIDRNAAKPLNFLCAYGGGEKALSDKLRLEHKTWSKEYCLDLARKALTRKKGEKKGLYYIGGTDSELYNYMDKLVSESSPRLAALDTMITRALLPKYCDKYNKETGVVNKEFFTGRANWLIQGCAAEFLDALLVAIKWLANHYNVTLRYVISIHDELWYITPHGQELKAAKIFQIAHLWVWSLLHYGLGMYEMPLAGAFISGVAIDNRVRKSVDECTTTISHDGSNEPDGREVTIFELEDIKL